MGNLKSLDIKHSYHKGPDDIASSFYLPCMRESNNYYRAVGFFSSTIYILAWSSLKEFIDNNSKMKILCSPILSNSDIDAISEGYDSRIEEKATRNLHEEIKNLLESPYLNKPTRILACLVAMECVDFKIAFINGGPNPKSKRLFHDKLGIFSDALGNSIVFKGSMNETWAGLSNDGNLESIDVFLSWAGDRESRRVEDEIKYFKSLWDDSYPSVTVKPFPDIAKKELIKVADLDKLPDLLEDIAKEIRFNSVISSDSNLGGRTPRPHQAHALLEWFERDRRGIFHHATGSGKTFTALCAIKDSLSRGEIPFVIVPGEELFDQWYDELSVSFPNVSILRCGSGNAKWREDKLLRIWSKPGPSPRLILSTVQTSSSPEFLNSISQGGHIFLVADEVHRLGSRKNRQIFTLNTGPRLGLSATPIRAGDDVGTQSIMDYFYGIVPPPFTLFDAIKSGTLTPYMYYVHVGQLLDQEQTRWERLSSEMRTIAARIRNSKGDTSSLQNRLELLSFERARIVKSASCKSDIALSVIQKYYQEGQSWIVYCDSLDQMRLIQSKLQEEGFHTIEYHSQMQGDRKQTRKLFEANGGIIVSIRCLDEGIDIPTITHALILASSKNPREFIQRRGRVLRRADHKALSFIHDTIIIPQKIGEDVPGLSIIEGELARAITFGKSAENPGSITDLQRIALKFGINYEKWTEEGYEDDE